MWYRYKFLTFPEEELVALVVWVGEGEIRVRAETPVKGLIFTFSDDVWLEDNCLDLIPGEERVFKVKGLKEETKVQWRCEFSVVSLLALVGKANAGTTALTNDLHLEDLGDRFSP